jgi:FkbM family methyltransferase
MPVMIRNLVAPRMTAEAPVIFDVGAHTGGTVAAYRTAFPTATIHAFEPDPELAGQLAAKVADDPGVILNQQAVGAAPGRQRFNICRAGANDAIGSFLDLNPDNEVVRNLSAERTQSLEVEVTSIDAYCRENGIDRIDFVKLDVQGYEDQCLLGAAGMLERHAIGLLQVELLLGDMYAKTLSFYDIEKVLVPAGYRLYAIDDIHPRVGAELFQFDAFYVPRIAKTADR